MSKPSQGDLSPASVSYTAGFYHIPVIGISSRDSAFSDKVRSLSYELMAFFNVAFIAEYPRVLLADRSSIFTPSQRLGGNVETIQISPIGLHSQFRH